MYLFGGGGGHMHGVGVEGQLVDSVLSFHDMDPGDQIPVLRFNGQHLHLLSQPQQPKVASLQ